MTDDEYIVKLFMERSEQAIVELEGSYGKLCRKISYNIVNNIQDAEECVNDAYLGVWNSIPPAKPKPLLTYVLKIVRNISLTRYYRNSAKKRKTDCIIALDELDAIISDNKSVESCLQAEEIAVIIGEFLDKQTYENRIIFMRRYWFCDSYNEISRMVGISEKNISVRLVRMRQKLKRYLIEKEVFYE